jgi:hypothetical protein
MPGMTVAANGEKVLRRPRDLDDFAAMWRSYQPACRRRVKTDPQTTLEG